VAFDCIKWREEIIPHGWSTVAYRAGEPVALVGDTGSLRGPCLYFEIRQRGKPLDPIEWLAQTRAK
jgi:hypothetical protein